MVIDTCRCWAWRPADCVEIGICCIVCWTVADKVRQQQGFLLFFPTLQRNKQALLLWTETQCISREQWGEDEGHAHTELPVNDSTVGIGLECYTTITTSQLCYIQRFWWSYLWRKENIIKPEIFDELVEDEDEDLKHTHSQVCNWVWFSFY